MEVEREELRHQQELLELEKQAFLLEAMRVQHVLNDSEQVSR